MRIAPRRVARSRSRRDGVAAPGVRIRRGHARESPPRDSRARRGAPRATALPRGAARSRSPRTARTGMHEARARSRPGARSRRRGRSTLVGRVPAGCVAERLRHARARARAARGGAPRRPSRARRRPALADRAAASREQRRLEHADLGELACARARADALRDEPARDRRSPRSRAAPRSSRRLEQRRDRPRRRPRARAPRAISAHGLERARGIVLALRGDPRADQHRRALSADSLGLRARWRDSRRLTTPWISCSERTPIEPLAQRADRADAPRARAAAVVKYGTPRSSALRRSDAESRTAAGSLPTVLITRSTSPAWMRSTVSRSPRAARPTFGTTSARTPTAASDAAVPGVASTRKPSSASSRTHGPDRRAVLLAHRDQHAAALRQRVAGLDLRLRVGAAEVRVDAHHLARALHLGAEQRVDAGELHEREHGLLHREVSRPDLLGEAELLERLRRPSRARRASRAAARSPSRRTAPCARRAGSPRARRRALPSPRTARSSGRARRASSASRRVASAICVDRPPSASEYGGSEQALSPEWTPACSMCSMMPPITTRSPSADRVDVDLDRVGEEVVDQHRLLGRRLHRVRM